MPKLSNARRHRRQHDLAGYCVNQTLRKVSEEDMQEPASLSSSSSSSTTTDRSMSQDCEIFESRPLLKRREPSTCLSDLCFLSPLPKVLSTNENLQGDTPSRTISPAWGHFVDVILDDESRLSPTPTPFGDDLPVWPGSSPRAHSPYGESARKRLRLRSPQRPNVKEEMDGFILQDPSTLHDALSRLSV